MDARHGEPARGSSASAGGREELEPVTRPWCSGCGGPLFRGECLGVLCRKEKR